MRRFGKVGRAGLLSVCLAGPGGLHAAEVVDLREWLQNVETLEEEVIRPLEEQFAQEACVPSLGYYLNHYLEALKKIRGKLHIKSYLIFREIGLITAQDVGIYVDSGPPEQTGACIKWQVWQDGVHVHFKNKIEFVGNIFSLTVWDDL